MSSQPATLMTRMRHRLQSLAYSSSLYQLIISGPVPKNLSVIPTDPWPGDAVAGQAVIDGEFNYGGQSFPSNPPTWLPEGVEPAWFDYVHSFAFLRDLRAVGGDTARRVARSLISSWCDQFEYWAADVWRVDLIADRITHLVALHDFMLGSADQSFRDRVFESMVRQLKHMLRLAPGVLGAGTLPAEMETGTTDPMLQNAQAVYGLDLLRVVRGLVFAGVAFPEGDKPLGFGLSLLPALMRQSMLPDGTARERSPTIQARLLKCLIDIRHALRLANIALPPELPPALDKAANALRAMRHGDGGLMLFHGSQEGDPLFIDALLTQSASRGRSPKSLKEGGYERMLAGRMLLLLDAGSPPAHQLDEGAHASTGAFEVSIGKERLFVNCGAHPSQGNRDWHQALAATAAHSTLTLNHKNSSEIIEDGGLGRRAQIIKRDRRVEDGNQIMQISHDGYQVSCGMVHERILNLSEDGDELKGSEILEGTGGIDYALRFHLHPLVQSSLIQNDRAVLLRLPSGTGFRLTLEEGTFAIEESLYYGKAAPRKSRQIVCYGNSGIGSSIVNWTLTREKMPKEKPVVERTVREKPEKQLAKARAKS